LTGLRFIQFYWPPARDDHPVGDRRAVFHARSHTAYEYLERRFDVRVRSLAALLFLMGRAFSFGVTLASGGRHVIDPGLDAAGDGPAICVPMILHHRRRRPGDSLDRREADVHRRRDVDRRRDSPTASCPTWVSVGALPCRHDRQAAGGGFPGCAEQRYTFWSGNGSLFPMLAYFGCDQSWVQRLTRSRSTRRGNR
jgi:hypothetical protein